MLRSPESCLSEIGRWKGMTYEVNGDTIPVVSSYKYLGYIIDEYLELKKMVKDRAEAGKRALGACFKRCRVENGDVMDGIFRKLIGSLVESTLIYGAELWGCITPGSYCDGSSTCLPNVFLVWAHALHLKIFLWFEMEILPLVWEVKMQCVRFWLTVMCAETYEDRLLNKLARHTVGYGKGAWVKNIANFVSDFR